ncbi:MAG: acetolactate synthase [Clostridia bacterium]|nr:acetolactate synthase [Clostridia bacterium]
MFIKQLSIFVENKFGRLEAILDCLSQNNINLKALSLADTADYGVLRVIVDDAEKAKKVLNEAGVIAKLTDVVAVYIDDRSGGLASVLSILKNAQISIEYMYAFLGRTEGKALMVLKAEDEAKTQKVLAENNISMASQNEI